MATINLGAIKFNWKGTYAGGTAYVVDDVVEYNGSSYVCILASTGNLPTNATYFEQMSSAGTNGTDGTDLTTTLTTQGDIVYRDASGLARLGAGTSGQVLQTNGTGANPSWGTVSSDYVKLAETNVTSTVARVDFINVFSSTYDNYKIFASGVSCDTSSPSIAFRYMNNTSYVSTNSYQTVIHGAYTDSSSVNQATSFDWSADKARIFDFGISSEDSNSSSFELTLLDPYTGTQNSTGHAVFTVNQQGYTYIEGGNTSFTVGLATSFDGISIFPTNQNFDKGSFKLYGIK